MKHLNLVSLMLLLAPIFFFSAPSQSSDSRTEHFAKQWVAFDYPADWKLTDGSVSRVQAVAVAPASKTAKIEVIAQPLVTESCDLSGEQQRIHDALLQRISTEVHAIASLRPSPVKTRVGADEINGVQLHGRVSGKPVTADIYSLRLKLDSINLVYLRIDSDKRADSAWDTVRTSLKLTPSIVMGAAKADKSEPGASESGTIKSILNGRAVTLVQPHYPPLAAKAHASGAVTVQVLIDESGDVIEAHAMDGHPLLQPASVAAAKASKFSVTKLCGEPVRVAGVIVYNFLAK